MVRLVFLLAIFLSGCASDRIQGAFHFAGTDGLPNNSVVTWPPVEEGRPRYVYVGQLLGEQNFETEKRTSKWSRFASWILGEDDDPMQELLRPVSTAVGPTGRIFVADMALRAILVFDGKGGEMQRWQELTLREPNGLVALDDGSLLVADAAAGEVLHLSDQGNIVKKFGKGLLKRPVGLAFDRHTKTVFVVDTQNHDIKTFALDGQLRGTFGERGTEPGQFNFPTFAAFAHGKLYVSDTMNSRVQILDPENGKTVRHFGERGLAIGNLVRPKGISVDRDGNVYIIESMHDYLLVFDAEGNLLLPLGGNGKDVGQFFSPAGVTVDAADRVFVSDMFNGRVMVMQYLGNDDE